ncbi:MAG: hypothetical protein LC101_10985 [Flavobacteriales bacterium]|nr:hypothetical protein [Flavobacteriales bacterium]
MKKPIIAALAVILACSSSLTAQIRNLNIEKASKKKILSYKGEIDSQSSDRKLRLSLKNKSKDTLYLHIEPGRIFYPNNDSYQPLVVYREKNIVLKPEESREVYLNALCGASNKGSNCNGCAMFNRSEMGSDEMQGVLRFLNQKRLDAHVDMQHLIWVFTNNHLVASIGRAGLDEKTYQALLIEIARLKGVLPPWYTVTYAEPEAGSRSVFTNKPVKIEGKISYFNQEKQDMQIVLRDESGGIIRYFKYINQQLPGEYNISLVADVSGINPGHYDVSIENSNERQVTSYDLAL